MKKCNSFFLNDPLMHIISENCTLSHIVRHLTMHLPFILIPENATYNTEGYCRLQSSAIIIFATSND
jgi:hypothetical protein